MNFLNCFKKTKPYYEGPLSDHFDGQRFFNPWNPHLPKFLDVLRWKLLSKPALWPSYVENIYEDISPRIVLGDDLQITAVGHSTFLIQTNGLNFLTDPIWSERASPFLKFGPKRISRPGITFENLPKIDLILVTHNHYDHLGLPTIHQLGKRDHPLILTPLGNDVIIQSYFPSTRIKTLDWGQSFKVNDDTVIHLEPCQHWSSRGMFDKNKALWGSFVIESPGGKIFFSGDTGYADGELFTKAHEKFGQFRVAFLPMGAYQPRWFMRYAHMGPEDAVKAHEKLGRPLTIPMHFQTFQLSDEAFSDPLLDLSRALKSSDKFHSLLSGQTLRITD